MSVRAEALERIDQTKRTLDFNLDSPHLDYMAYLGAIIECNLLIDQFRLDQNKKMLFHHTKMKKIIVNHFEAHCIQNGYKYK